MNKLFSKYVMLSIGKTSSKAFYLQSLNKPGSSCLQLFRRSLTYEAFATILIGVTCSISLAFPIDFHGVSAKRKKKAWFLLSR